jgi:hypothetical protein
MQELAADGDVVAARDEILGFFPLAAYMSGVRLLAESSPTKL